MRSLVSFLGFVLLVAVVAGTAAIWSPDAWYAGLHKPSWNPPGWVFGPVWGVLYLAIATAGWRLWQAEASVSRTVSMWLWTAQLALNAAWTPLFFGLHQPLVALLDILLLVAVIGASFGWFRQSSQLAAWLFAPYLLWVLFATALNAAIVILN